MTNTHIFGYTNITGMYLKDFLTKTSCDLNNFYYSRKSKSYVNLDLLNPTDFNPQMKKEKDNIWISLAPIWNFSKFLLILDKNNNSLLKKVKLLVVCSSSSIKTKKYSFSKFDNSLVKKLIDSEKKIIKICSRNKIKLIILRPTMIFGSYFKFIDSNISKIKQILRFLPIIIIPKETGKRQPIHARDLAYFLLLVCEKKINYKNCLKILEIGGDEELTYNQMILELKRNISRNNLFRFPILVKIPNSLFYFFCSPLLLFSPKLYESILRISYNLNGFTKINKLSKLKPNTFRSNLELKY